jgi:hypothetical protein
VLEIWALFYGFDLGKVKRAVVRRTIGRIEKWHGGVNHVLGGVELKRSISFLVCCN